MKVNIRGRESSVVDKSDLIGWTLVAVAAVAGIYACLIFNSIVGGIAYFILKIFI